jgi:hypothetical protein
MADGILHQIKCLWAANQGYNADYEACVEVYIYVCTYIHMYVCADKMN